MKKFNLNEALDGKPVQLRDGRKAFVKAVINQPENLKYYTVIGYAYNGIHEEFLSWDIKGNCLPDDISDDDIVGMWEEPKRFINGIEVQQPLTMKTCVNGEKYWFVDLQSSELVTEMPLYYFNTESLNLVDRGLAFRRKQDAKAMAKALLNYKVEYKDGSCEETNKNNSGWIDINEKLPPFETEVLGRCIVDNEELIIIVSRESQDGEYWFSPVNFSGVCEDETVEVTHWQPLPELPQNQA